MNEIIDQLLEEYINNGEKPLTRLQIGETLNDYDMNNGNTMKLVISKLIELGVKIT